MYEYCNSRDQRPKVQFQIVDEDACEMRHPVNGGGYMCTHTSLTSASVTFDIDRLIVAFLLRVWVGCVVCECDNNGGECNSTHGKWERRGCREARSNYEY